MKTKINDKGGKEKMKKVGLIGLISLLLVAVILVAGCLHRSSYIIKEGEASVMIEGKAYPVHYSVKYVNAADGRDWYSYDIFFEYIRYSLWIVEEKDSPGKAIQMELYGRDSDTIATAHFSPTGNYAFQYGAVSERELEEFPFPTAVVEALKPFGEIGTGAFLGEEAANQLLEMGNSIIKQLKPY